MSDFTVYLYGLGSIVLFILYIVLFNFTYWKVTDVKLWETDLAGVVAMPIIIIMVICILLSVPLAIGRAVLGLY